MAKNGVDGIIVVAKGDERAQQLKRVLTHLNSPWVFSFDSFTDTEMVIERQEPELVIIDMSEMSYGEFIRKVEPFILSLPGRIKTLLIDPEPTMDNVLRASGIGVDGILKAPVSHYMITTLLAQIESAKNGR